MRGARVIVQNVASTHLINLSSINVMRGMVFFLMRGTNAVGGTFRTASHHDGCDERRKLHGAVVVTNCCHKLVISSPSACARH